ncbi:MAG: LicD family protein, partial [Solobacterium sp.]|nr:LicD family protein [Solobacterium sp.]
MIELDNVTLRKVQLIQREMLIEVDRICRKHDISYTIIAGTLLGAVRHKGY